ncbi:MAG TPA: PQQ-dependent sugar dehydrogenase, partial [Candidatus Dormibacteraeota bacterium]|nr:PQQ-dependent sugar dehydrogenase [Candidatus Dormibacteraeota bacterium]
MFSGLTYPTAVRFASDGRVFVAEKSGLIKVFDSLSDPTPHIFADLRTNVFNGWDRGLLGLALDPAFPTNPYVYVAYTYDHILGDPAPAPRWGTVNGGADNCPTPPGANTDGCVVSGRVSRLTAAGDAMTGPEQVLVEDWCQQFPSHSMGDLQFGQDGSLYVSGGDGASYDWVDYGQAGNPVNPCGDPPSAPGTPVTPPTAEGGALRSQDLRTPGDPTGLNGTIIRIDPATGAALPTNPLYGSSDANARRIIAYGLRNPFRYAVRPGTNELWVADVGWTDWEEIDRISNPADATVENFGWPCYEGMGRQSGYENANLNICTNLYAQPGADTKPYYTYSHSSAVVPGDGCTIGSSALSGAAFELAGSQNPYPASYDNAFFFADYGRGCIWAMKADS